MTTKAAPANTPAGDFIYRFNPRTNKWHVFESGKFRWQNSGNYLDKFAREKYQSLHRGVGWG